MSNANVVYQFKITLKEIKPPLWRRIQVPATYSFWDLHVAIQDSMGWTDTHLHNFEILNPVTHRLDEIGIPDTEFFENDIKPGWKKKIAAGRTDIRGFLRLLWIRQEWGQACKHAFVLQHLVNYPHPL